MRRALLVCAAALLAACGSGAGGGPRTGSAIRGTFTLTSSTLAGALTSCAGTGGYSDFAAGMNVTVKDGSGRIVGVGSATNLSDDDLPATTTPPDDLEFQLAGVQASAHTHTQCWLKFTVPIKKADFYQIEVGHRGGLSYSYDDLKKNDFFVQLTLGET